MKIPHQSIYHAHQTLCIVKANKITNNKKYDTDSCNILTRLTCHSELSCCEWSLVCYTYYISMFYLQKWKHVRKVVMSYWVHTLKSTIFTHNYFHSCDNLLCNRRRHSWCIAGSMAMNTKMINEVLKQNTHNKSWLLLQSAQKLTIQWVWKMQHQSIT